MIPAFLLVLFVVVYRIVAGLLIQSGAGWLSNFAPFAAIALCCGAFFPSKLKLSIPLVGLFISDVVLNIYYSAPMFTAHIIGRYLALAAIAFIGLLLQNRASFKTLLPASIVSSSLFYFISVVFSWASDPGYVKNFGGLVQALTVGLPQYSTTPSWMFYRNSLVSDLLFTVAFIACMNFARNAQRSRAGATMPRAA
jgi:Na+/H+ antiporter NhaA